MEEDVLFQPKGNIGTRARLLSAAPPINYIDSMK